jgi:hypothetical protein
LLRHQAPTQRSSSGGAAQIMNKSQYELIK